MDIYIIFLEYKWILGFGRLHLCAFLCVCKKTCFVSHLYFLIILKFTFVLCSLISRRKLTFLFCIFKNLPEEEEDGKAPTQPLLNKGRHFPSFCVKSFFHIVDFSYPFVILSTPKYHRGKSQPCSVYFFLRICFRMCFILRDWAVGKKKQTKNQHCGNSQKNLLLRRDRA